MDDGGEKGKQSGGKAQLRALATLLPTVYVRKQWLRQWQVQQIYQAWESLIGADAAQHSAPAYFRGEILWVYAKNGPWAQELRYHQSRILDAIHELGIEGVNGMRLLIQADFFVDERRENKRPSSQEVPPRPNYFDAIESEECRQALKQLWEAFS